MVKAVMHGDQEYSCYEESTLKLSLSLPLSLSLSLFLSAL